ncbi:hypothetical protein MA20_45655 [Bradyrhizobium japonicum]|uniref:Uncharacterized protein n=1 Tax=Bradyrhizobium japonicum TaxID=375 RepID=A0A0A3XJ87_BRAJP|nr:hypothetical protein MA20_45655 [Bradyrhizobium japonicum]
MSLLQVATYSEEVQSVLLQDQGSRQSSEASITWKSNQEGRIVVNGKELHTGMKGSAEVRRNAGMVV